MSKVGHFSTPRICEDCGYEFNSVSASVCLDCKHRRAVQKSKKRRALDELVLAEAK